MDKKTQPAYMLSIRDLPQNKRSTQVESEGIEKKYSKQTDMKKSWCGNTYIRQNRINNKGHKKDTDGHSIIFKGIVSQEDITLVNIYTFNTGSLKCTKRILENFWKETDSNTVIVGDFNTPLSRMDISFRKNISKDIVALNNALDQMNLTNI